MQAMNQALLLNGVSADSVKKLIDDTAEAKKRRAQLARTVGDVSAAGDDL